MFRLRSLAVVVLLVASSLVTLRLMGWSQWIQAILVIGVELSLGIVLHAMIEGSTRRERQSRHRPPRRLSPSGPRRKQPGVHAHRSKVDDKPVEPLSVAAYSPTCRLLLPLRDDRPGLIEFAIRESRAHRAELDLLFVRRLNVFPMGSVSTPTEADDEEARAVIERARRLADREGIPFRSLYEVTSDPAGTILEWAEAREADLVVMPAPRRGGFIAKRMARDDLKAVLNALPEHISLLVHA